MALTFTLLCSFLALGFALRLAPWVLEHDDGAPEMRTISNAIREGAEAFLLRQYKTIALLTLPVACVIFALYAYLRPPTVHDPVAAPWELASYAAGAFIFGVVCCGMSPFDATKGLGSPCI